MSEMEKKMNGVEAMDDDELDAAVGGAGDSGMTLSQAKAAAKQEGRKQMPPETSKAAGKMCSCPVEWKFYGSVQRVNLDLSRVYKDVKCYTCNATARELKYS